MEPEDATNLGLVGWLNQTSSPATVQDRQRSADDLSDDGPDDDPIMFMPTPPPVGPRVWPGL